MALDAQSQALIKNGQVKVGLRHSVVAAVRDLLYKAGVPLTYSPRDPFTFDAGLRDQVLVFQRARKLAADGIVGPRTWNALAGMGMGTPDASRDPMTVTVDPARATPGAPPVTVPDSSPLVVAEDEAPASTSSVVPLLLLAVGGFLAFRWFKGRKASAPALGDFGDREAIRLMTAAESDARLGRCPKAIRAIRNVRSLVSGPVEERFFKKAAAIVSENCQPSKEEEEDVETIERAFAPQLPLRRGRAFNPVESRMRRDYFDLRAGIREAEEMLASLKGRTSEKEVKFRAQLESELTDLRQQAKTMRDDLQRIRRKIDIEEGIGLKVGRPRSLVVAKRFKTGSKKKGRPSVTEIVSTPIRIEVEPEETRALLRRVAFPADPVAARARAFIEKRFRRQPSVPTEEGTRTRIELRPRRPRSPTEAEWPYFEKRGFRRPSDKSEEED